MLMLSVVEKDAKQFVARITVYISGALEEACPLIENNDIVHH